MVKLAVAILHRTVSASPGFDSRPMQLLTFFLFSWTLCGGCGEQRYVFKGVVGSARDDVAVAGKRP